MLAIIATLLQTNFPHYGNMQRLVVLQHYTTHCGSFTEHVLYDCTDKIARIGDLVKPLLNKASARSPLHVRTYTRDSVKMSITSKQDHAILGSHANAIYGFTTRLRRKHAYTRHRNKRASSFTTIPFYCA